MGGNELDLRGLACPIPALEVKKALTAAPSEESVSVLVDCGSAEENVPRAAAKAGWKLSSREELPDGSRRMVFSRG